MCKHCGRRILAYYGGNMWTHYYGPGSNVIRCKPEESGQPYGLNAESAEE